MPQRIDVVDPVVNATLTLFPEQAKSSAARATHQWKLGRARSLEGVPFGVKDVIFTAGVRTTGGSTIYQDFVPEYSATVVRRLEEAGAILIAKLQTFEFATGDNSHHGPTRNPWDLSRTAGGSSGGSAAALAAREMPLALGTDTGGSIRVPAALCGVTGFKPTYGRISRHGVMPLSWTLDHVGPMARSVEDVMLVFDAVAGYDNNDPTSLVVPFGKAESGLTIDKITLGVPSDLFFDLIDVEVETATKQALALFESYGARLVEVALPHAHLSEAMGALIMYAESASLHEPTYDRLGQYSQPLTQSLIARAPFVSARDYLRALRLRSVLQKDLEEAFASCDAIIVPTVLSVAPKLDELRFDVSGESYEWIDVVARLTMMF